MEEEEEASARPLACRRAGPPGLGSHVSGLVGRQAARARTPTLARQALTTQAQAVQAGVRRTSVLNTLLGPRQPGAMKSMSVHISGGSKKRRDGRNMSSENRKEVQKRACPCRNGTQGACRPP